MGESHRQREWAPVATTAAWWHRRGEGGRGLKAKKGAYWLSFSSYCVSLAAYHKLHGRKFRKPKTILHHRSQTYILCPGLRTRSQKSFTFPFCFIINSCLQTYPKFSFFSSLLTIPSNNVTAILSRKNETVSKVVNC